jgi:hypothetical protein
MNTLLFLKCSIASTDGRPNDADGAVGRLIQARRVKTTLNFIA